MLSTNQRSASSCVASDPDASYPLQNGNRRGKVTTKKYVPNILEYGGEGKNDMHIVQCRTGIPGCSVLRASQARSAGRWGSRVKVLRALRPPREQTTAPPAAPAKPCYFRLFSWYQVGCTPGPKDNQSKRNNGNRYTNRTAEPSKTIYEIHVCI